MDELEREKLEQKIKTCEKLGAVSFQKLVFTAEKLKYSTIHRFFPNYLVFNDKIIEHEVTKKLKKITNEEDKTKLLKVARMAKMTSRRELNYRQNRNYHINNNNPTIIYDYFNWNKNIHKKGLIKNAIFLPIFLSLSIVNFPVAMPLLVIELCSAFLNFECINIQNYNIYRYKKAESSIKKRVVRQYKNNIEKYGEASEVVFNSLDRDNTKLPSVDEIVENITTKEQAVQMKELIDKMMNERKSLSSEKNTNQFVKKKS